MQVVNISYVSLEMDNARGFSKEMPLVFRTQEGNVQGFNSD